MIRFLGLVYAAVAALVIATAPLSTAQAAPAFAGSGNLVRSTVPAQTDTVQYRGRGGFRRGGFRHGGFRGRGFYGRGYARRGFYGRRAYFGGPVYYGRPAFYGPRCFFPSGPHRADPLWLPVRPGAPRLPLLSYQTIS